MLPTSAITTVNNWNSLAWIIHEPAVLLGGAGLSALHFDGHRRNPALAAEVQHV
jgi:hypothetical protein